MRAGWILLILGIACLQPSTTWAIDVFFVPDTIAGNTGQVVQLSVQISATAPMRGFTVYMSYDTNRFDLYDAPTPGPVIAGHSGLQFNYFDHAPFLPDLLEVTGTIFGSAFWNGPGELFTLRFILRGCGDEPITAPYAPFFVAADDTYPPGVFYPALVMICDRVPQPANGLTVHPDLPGNVILRWLPVTQDTLGRPLFSPPLYAVYRQQILPSELPPVNIATVTDTFYADPFSTGTEYLYHIITESNP